MGVIHFGEGNYPECKLDRYFNVDDTYLVNLEMQQYTHGISTMEMRIVRQHSTIIASKEKTMRSEMISVWFLAKGRLTKDDELVHLATLDLKAGNQVVKTLPFGGIYLVEMEKVKNKIKPGKTKMERFCQFMLRYNDPRKEKLMRELKEDELIMDCVRRVNTYNYDLREMCKMIKKELDEMSIQEVRKEAEQAGRKEGERKGLSMGIRKGKREGKKEGKKEGMATILMQMYKNGMSIEEIANITKQSQDEILQMLHMGKSK